MVRDREAFEKWADEYHALIVGDLYDYCLDAFNSGRASLAAEAAQACEMVDRAIVRFRALLAESAAPAPDLVKAARTARAAFRACNLYIAGEALPTKRDTLAIIDEALTALRDALPEDTK